jgi:replicative DNA helicase
MSEEKTGRRETPKSEEAERAVLGSALVEPIRVIALLKERYLFTNEHFFFPAHRLLWEQLEALFRAGKPIDLVSSGEALETAGLLDQVGGYEFIEGLIDKTPTSAHAEYYAQQVRAKWILRKAISEAQSVIDKAYLPSSSENPEAFLSEAPNGFMQIASGVVREVKRTDAFAAVIDEVEYAKERQVAIAKGEIPPAPRYISTPWEEINQSIGGGYRNYFHVIGAESSAGKTTLVGQLAEHIASVHGKKVFFLSMDADAEEHAARDMSRNSGVSLPKLMSGFARRNQIEAFKAQAARLAKLPIVIDSKSFTLDAQEASIRMNHMRGDIGIVIVDYFQLTRLGDHKVDMMENYRISACCKRYKELSRELGCPVIGLSQVNRTAHTQNRFIMKQDLRGSGEIDEVAHTILLLYKDRDLTDGKGKVVHKAAKEENHIRPVWWEWVKNKNGPLGAYETWMYSNYFKFEVAAEGAFEVAANRQELGQLAHGLPARDDDGPEQEYAEQESMIL